MSHSRVSEDRSVAGNRRQSAFNWQRTSQRSVDSDFSALGLLAFAFRASGNTAAVANPELLRIAVPNREHRLR